MSRPWKNCDYSRRDIDRAGDVLRAGLSNTTFEEYLHAYSVMESWRSSHAFPLNTLQMTLRRRASSINRKAQIVQRLKRAPSVISKLRRFENMQLSRIQDLGGCRAIMPTVKSVEDVRRLYVQSRDRHELATEKNYIEKPQDSGYRGIHLVYKYESDRNSDFNGRRVEIQLRTAVQHAWATAVEIAGVYVKTSLKSSIGPEPWLEFFRFASSAFSILEGRPKLHEALADREIIEELLELDRQLEARKKLSSFMGAHQFLSENRRKSDSHFILILDLREQVTRILPFASIAPASVRYAELEKEHIDDDLVDVVLVAAESVESVATAYPNYFGDTTEFLKYMERIFDQAIEG